MILKPRGLYRDLRAWRKLSSHDHLIFTQKRKRKKGILEQMIRNNSRDDIVIDYYHRDYIELYDLKKYAYHDAIESICGKLYICMPIQSYMFDEKYHVHRKPSFYHFEFKHYEPCKLTQKTFSQLDWLFSYRTVLKMICLPNDSEKIVDFNTCMDLYLGKYKLIEDDNVYFILNDVVLKHQWNHLQNYTFDTCIIKLDCTDGEIYIDLCISRNDEYQKVVSLTRLYFVEPNNIHYDNHKLYGTRRYNLRNLRHQIDNTIRTWLNEMNNFFEYTGWFHDVRYNLWVNFNILLTAYKATYFIRPLMHHYDNDSIVDFLLGEGKKWCRFFALYEGKNDLQLCIRTFICHPEFRNFYSSYIEKPDTPSLIKKYAIHYVHFLNEKMLRVWELCKTLYPSKFKIIRVLEPGSESLENQIDLTKNLTAESLPLIDKRLASLIRQGNRYVEQENFSMVWKIDEEKDAIITALKAFKKELELRYHKSTSNIIRVLEPGSESLENQIDLTKNLTAESLPLIDKRLASLIRLKTGIFNREISG